MKLLQITFFLLWTFMIQVSAQDTLFSYFTHEFVVDSLTEGYYTNSAFIGSIELEDSYVSCGLTGPGPEKWLLLEKFNKANEVLMTRTIMPPVDSIYGIYTGSQFILNDDGNLALIYHKYNNLHPLNWGDMGIMVFDLNLEIIQNNLVVIPYGQECLSACRSHDGGYMICAQSQDSLDTEVASPHILVMKSDIDGHILWQRYYYKYPHNFTRAYSIIPTEDGNYMIGGFLKTANSFNGYPRPWLLKIDEQGDTLWTKIWGDSEINTGPINVYSYDNGQIIGNWQADSSWNSSDYHDHIISIDLNGEFSNHLSFLTNVEIAKPYLDHIFPYGSGYRGLGIKWNEYFADDILWIDLSQDYVPIEFHRIGYESNLAYKVKDFDPTSDGGFLVTGFTLTLANPPPQKGFVFKIDSLGNFCGSWGCDSLVIDSTTYISYLQDFDAGRYKISTAPNPCKDHFVLSYQLPQESENVWWRLYDINGIERRSLRLLDASGEREVTLRHCDPGLYLWRLSIGNRVVENGKLIVKDE